MIYILFIVKVLIITYILHNLINNRISCQNQNKMDNFSKNKLKENSELKEYKKILGIGNDLDIESLRIAYRKQVKKNHPDLFQKENEKIKATQKMLRINKAYQFLTEYIKNQAKIPT